MKTRLDRLLVERGLAESREKAQALIMAGEVLLNGQKAAKPGQPVAPDAALQVLARPPYVSRGGLKLAAALRHFAIDVAGQVCLDIGSSTGGFTDALLQAGASRVHAVDVGKGQLAWPLRTDARVVIHEGVNARELEFARIGELVWLLSIFLTIRRRLRLPRRTTRSSVVLGSCGSSTRLPDTEIGADSGMVVQARL